MLELTYQNKFIEAGCDEAGRGCLAGPVFAAAVILPSNFSNSLLNDSKKLTRKVRDELRLIIEREAVAYSVAQVDSVVIDEINILNASIRAMHLALNTLNNGFAFIAVDGNRFKNYGKIPHQTIVGGDGKFMNIAAASVLAKTHRDEFMESIDKDYPQYNWINNKGYGTKAHCQAIMQFGYTPFHRKSFVVKQQQPRLFP